MASKILILDDNPDILTILSFILHEEGYAVETQADGSGVFTDIEQFQPDLLLIDVMLGNLDGRQICKQLKSNAATKALPVILISGTHDLTRSLNQPGAPDDFIAKPFELDLVLQKIARQLQKKSGNPMID